MEIKKKKKMEQKEERKRAAALAAAISTKREERQKKKETISDEERKRLFWKDQEEQGNKAVDLLVEMCVYEFCDMYAGENVSMMMTSLKSNGRAMTRLHNAAERGFEEQCDQRGKRRVLVELMSIVCHIYTLR